MELPIGFRVSGPFQRKGPINSLKGIRNWLTNCCYIRALQRPVTNNMRLQAHIIYEGGLLRSPPEWRALYVYACGFYKMAQAPGPDY